MPDGDTHVILRQSPALHHSTVACNARNWKTFEDTQKRETIAIGCDSATETKYEMRLDCND